MAIKSPFSSSGSSDSSPHSSSKSSSAYASDHAPGKKSFPQDRSKPVLPVSSGWVQGVAIVMLLGFAVLGVLAYRTYSDSIPIPQQVVSEDHQVVYTHDDVVQGQQIFLGRGLMQYGSVLGHGAYLGEDYTADYLHRATEFAKKYYQEHPRKDKKGFLIPAEKLVADEFRTNRYDKDSGTLVLTPLQVQAFHHIVQHYKDYFMVDSTQYGLPPKFIKDPEQVRQLTAFFSWTAWGAAAERPGKGYSYTNNWPQEDNVHNSPTANVVVWSVLSLIALIGGTGLLFTIYGRWSQKIGWHTNKSMLLSYKEPGTVALTKSQRAVAWFIATIGLLFLAQTFLGGLIEHYRAEIQDFYGIPIAKILPFNLARTWHQQLALFWVAASFLAAGLFITSFIARKEPKRQHVLVYVLYGAVAFVVFGSLLNELLSIHGLLPITEWFSQQWEYLDLPRFFQVLLTAGMFIWMFIIYRAMRGTLSKEHKTNMPWLFFFSGLTIPGFYAAGMLAKNSTAYPVADYWRFWVVHLWVEDFLELFTTIMIAYIFVLLGVIRERIALGIIFLDVILYSAGGVIGTMHHLYFSGTPAEHMALGAFFSAGEVIPLTLLTVEAWAFMQIGSDEQGHKKGRFPHRWAVMFFMAVGFWNFVGAGIFGFLINLPIVSYYEIGTGLTANHGHGAMMGVYGMLGLGLCTFCLRYILPPKYWSEKIMKLSFWCTNIGLVWMVFVSLLPVGVLQLYHSVKDGYWRARSLEELNSTLNSLLEWFRLPGDVIFIFGAACFCFMAVRGLIHYRQTPTTDRFEEDPLYEEITHPVDEEDTVSITDNTSVLKK